MANNPIVNMFKVKEIRSRIFFTFIVLAVYRLGSVLTIPGINPQALTSYFESLTRGNAFVDYMDFFAGGAFSNFSVFMLGVMPYISTQIIMQLALIIFPSLKRLAQEDGGQKRVQKWTRVGTVFVCLIQSMAVTVYATSIPGAVVISSSVLFKIIAMITVTTGTMSNNGAVSKTLDVTSISYTIPKGYHTGMGKVQIVLFITFFIISALFIITAL